jgi:hypothetical protein
VQQVHDDSPRYRLEYRPNLSLKSGAITGCVYAQNGAEVPLRRCIYAATMARSTAIRKCSAVRD